MSSYHTPVMPKEVLQLLDVQKNSWYIDCNLGGGGHTEEILKRGGNVLGLDLDPEAVKFVANRYGLKTQEVNGHLQAISENLIIYQTNFANVDEAAEKFGIKPEGILFDLGVSTYQLETANRGFSFNLDAPLDMRMNPNIGVPAKDLVNGLYEKELAGLFWKFGEERFARQIAKKIVQERGKKPIQTTNELANIILSVRHRTPADRTHPATRVFQALRIAVNDELNSLTEALPKAFEILQPGGKLVIISFHSLEDRIVKNFFANLVKLNKAKPLTKKPAEPTEEEIKQNPRSRSGKLRGVEKI